MMRSIAANESLKVAGTISLKAGAQGGGNIWCAWGDLNTRPTV